MVSSYKVSIQAGVAACLRSHLALQSSPTRTQLLLCLSVAGHGRHGPSVPLRWRPARGIRSAVSLRSRLALRSQALGMPREQDRWLRPCRFARSGSVSRHFTLLPVSQRLKPKSSMPERFCISPFAPAAQRVCHLLGSQGRCTSSHVSSLKQERVGSQQPPNPSFKRTRLRRSA